MTEQTGGVKSKLMANIERSWTELNATLDGMTEAQMTGQVDAAGWTVKDHIIHIALWELSVVHHLSGRPRHEAFGVERAQFEGGDFNATNALAQQKYKDILLPDALARMRAVHQDMMAALAPLSDSDLQKPFRRWRAGESGEGEGPAVLGMIYGNMSEHYDEHILWMKAIAQKQ